MRIVRLNLLKKLGVTLVAILFGAALLQKIFADAPGAVSALFAALLLLSPVAYVIREASRKRPARKAMRRARERTRVAAGQAEEE